MTRVHSARWSSLNAPRHALRERVAELEQTKEYARQLANNACKEVGKRDKRIAELEARLEKIANYPDPDFPAEDAAEEAKRAWRIVYTLKNMALGGDGE